MTVTITYDGATPTVGADADTWGGELNVGALAKIKVDLDALALTPANTIKGNNTGGATGVDDLTPAEVVAMLPSADLTARLSPGYARAAGALIAVTATTATLTNGLNVASVTWGDVDGSNATVAVAFTSAMSNANYHVVLTGDAATSVAIAGPTVNSTTRTTGGFTLTYAKAFHVNVNLSVFAA